MLEHTALDYRKSTINQSYTFLQAIESSFSVSSVFSDMPGSQTPTLIVSVPHSGIPQLIAPFPYNAVSRDAPSAPWVRHKMAFVANLSSLIEILCDLDFQNNDAVLCFLHNLILQSFSCGWHAYHILSQILIFSQKKEGIFHLMGHKDYFYFQAPGNDVILKILSLNIPYIKQLHSF